MHRLLALLLTLLVGAACSRLAAEEEVPTYRVVASPDVALEGIDRDDLRKLFLGLKTRVDDVALTPVLLAGGVAHRDFLRDVVHKSEAGFRLYWRKQVFSGNGRMPTTFETEAQLLAHLRHQQNLIGYVAADADVTGLTILELR